MTELALESDSPAEQREYLAMVDESADALLYVLNDILDFSRIEAGKLALEAIPFILQECIENTFRALAVKAREKRLRLTFSIAEDVPATIIGDPGRVRQILLNLVGNGIKFTERGQVSVRVNRADEQESAQSESCRLMFAVEDTGIGIPPDKQKILIQPFTQADGSVTRQFGGTGLGLAICKRLSELMHGTLWLESELESSEDRPQRGRAFRH